MIFLLVVGATFFRLEWFFPAAMIVGGIHYIPIITLYGVKIFGPLAVLGVLDGTALSLYGPAVFSLGKWLTGALFIGFLGKRMVKKEE